MKIVALMVLAGGSAACGHSGASSTDGGMHPDGEGLDATALIDAPAAHDHVELASSYTSTCARWLDGTVSCWGTNHDGLGLAATSVASTPTTITGLSHISGLVANNTQTFATLADGSVESWGDNDLGALGLGTPVSGSACGATECELTPTATLGGAHPRMLAIGATHGCMVDASNAVECWGENTCGELGSIPATAEICAVDGSATLPCHRAAHIVAGLSDVVDLSAGPHVTCAVRSDGTVWCWGDDVFDQIGSTTTGLTTCGGDACIPAPARVIGVATASQVVVGTSFVCALLADHSVSCWGDDSAGELGIGYKTAWVSTPTAVTGLASVTSLARGSSNHMCTVLDGGGVSCRGVDQHGEGGGAGDTIGRTTPAPVTH